MDLEPDRTPPPGGLAPAPGRWTVDLLIAAALVIAAFVPFGDPSGPGAFGLRSLPLLLAAALVLTLRRERPVPVLAGTLTVAVSAALVGLETPVFALPVALAVFTLADRRPRRTAVAGTAAAAAVLLTTCAVQASGGPLSSVLLSDKAGQLVAIVACAAALGAANSARRATLHAYADRAQRAEEGAQVGVGVASCLSAVAGEVGGDGQAQGVGAPGAVAEGNGERVRSEGHGGACLRSASSRQAFVLLAQVRAADTGGGGCLDPHVRLAYD